jgi:hypothetical protein
MVPTLGAADRCLIERLPSSTDSVVNLCGPCAMKQLEVQIMGQNYMLGCPEK